MTHDEIRFGLGRWDGLRSTSWKVWSGTDSSVYVIAREIGGLLKVSLHPQDESRPGGEWRRAVTTERLDMEGIDLEGGGRVLDSWDSEAQRIPGTPLHEAFAVVLGRFSLGSAPLPEEAGALAKLLKARWVEELPSEDQAWQFTVLITDPGVVTSPPGTRAMGSVPVGVLSLANGGQAWVMRHLIAVNDLMRHKITDGAHATVALQTRSEGQVVYRGLIQGKDESGLRWTIEVAVTQGAPADALAI